MSRVDSALEALYEDASLRDELRDDEANELLKWAEAELVKLDTSGATDADFESKIAQLRQLVRGMNRFVGRRAEISAQGADDAVTRLTDQAAALGYSLTPEQLAQFGAQSAAADGVSAVQGLTKLISSAGGAPATEPPPLPAQTAEPDASPPSPPTEAPPPVAVDEAAPPPEPPAEPSVGSLFQKLWGHIAPPADTSPPNAEETDPHGP